MNKQYTKSFKIEAVKKVLSRDSETTMKEIANSLNVKISTLHGWVKAAESQKLHENHDSGEKRPQDWTSLEKLTALIEADSLDPEAKSAYCREKGIFPHNLQGPCCINPLKSLLMNNLLFSMKKHNFLIINNLRRFMQQGHWGCRSKSACWI